jgi:hypothetical protein
MSDRGSASASVEFAGAAIRLAPGDIDAEAADLGCTPAVIRAVCDVEAGGSGFLPDARPKILFEAHLFGRLTGHRWDASWPNISAPAWDRSLYGAGGAHQYSRLQLALALDRGAALQSASWGMFQVLGTNHAACGYPDVESFVAAMVEGERGHLDAFTKFCISNHLDDELRALPPQFAAFARGYNGPGYATNAYDTKLAGAWRKWRAIGAGRPANDNPAPRTAPELHYGTLQLNSYGDGVAQLQRQLVALGFAIDVDRDFGAETQWAVVGFQKTHGLVPDGVAGPMTHAAIERAIGPGAHTAGQAA